MTLGIALDTANRGWPVFPAYLTEDGQKRPRLRGWQAEATNSQRTIRGWWERWPDALVAVPTGERSGLYVVDIDSRDALEAAVKLVGSVTPWEAPSRREGHWHWLFFGGGPCRSSAGKLHPTLDVRGEGGYVIAWHALPNPGLLPPLPSSVRTASLRRSGPRDPDAPPSGPVPLHAACVGVRMAREGTRNQTLNRWAWATAPQVLAGLLPEAEWRAALIAASVESGYPYDEAEEVLRCVLEARRSR